MGFSRCLWHVTCYPWQHRTYFFFQIIRPLCWQIGRFIMLLLYTSLLPCCPVLWHTQLGEGPRSKSPQLHLFQVVVDDICARMSGLQCVECLAEIFKIFAEYQGIPVISRKWSRNYICEVLWVPRSVLAAWLPEGRRFNAEGQQTCSECSAAICVQDGAPRKPSTEAGHDLFNLPKPSLRSWWSLVV